MGRAAHPNPAHRAKGASIGREIAGCAEHKEMRGFTPLGGVTIEKECARISLGRRFVRGRMNMTSLRPLRKCIGRKGSVGRQSARIAPSPRRRLQESADYNLNDAERHAHGRCDEASGSNGAEDGICGARGGGIPAEPIDSATAAPRPPVDRRMWQGGRAACQVRWRTVVSARPMRGDGTLNGGKGEAAKTCATVHGAARWIMFSNCPPRPANGILLAGLVQGIGRIEGTSNKDHPT